MRLGAMLSRVFHGLADILMPPNCVTCKAPVLTAHHHCADCWQELRPIGGAACAQCGVPLATAWRTEDICLGCMKEPPPFDSARAAFVYHGTARDTVLKFKNGHEHLGRLMAAAMVRAVQEKLTPDTLLVPVPLHRWRLLDRGYNQSVLLARAMQAASPTAISRSQLLIDGLERIKATPKTIGASRATRIRTMSGAFAVRAGARSRVAGATVLLIDDVFTTGATVSAAARVLRRAGAARIDVITYARVAPDDGVAYFVN